MSDVSALVLLFGALLVVQFGLALVKSHQQGRDLGWWDGKGAPTLPGPLDDGDLLAAAEESRESWEPGDLGDYTPLPRTYEKCSKCGGDYAMRHYCETEVPWWVERAVEAKAAKTEQARGRCPNAGNICNCTGACRPTNEQIKAGLDGVRIGSPTPGTLFRPFPNAPVASAGAGPVAPEEARPEPASSGVPEAIITTLGKHSYSPVNHSSIGSADHCSCGERPWTEQGWRKHVAPLISAAIDAIPYASPE